MTPVSAPSMIGIDPARVPDSRFTMLNEVLCPASAQHSSAMTNRKQTSPSATRRHTLLSGAKARATASAIEIPPHT